MKYIDGKFWKTVFHEKFSSTSMPSLRIILKLWTASIPGKFQSIWKCCWGKFVLLYQVKYYLINSVGLEKRMLWIELN